MKRNIEFKILAVAVIIAICLISFVGAYKKSNNQMESIIPTYKFGMDLNGAREVVLKVSDDTEKVTYDADGNVTEEGLDEEGNLKEGYTQEDVKVNKDELLTEKNFKTSKEIIEKRLKALGVNEYEVRQNNENGTLTIELPENDDTDTIISNLTYKGKFEIVDSETKEVLLNNSYVKESRAVYSTADNGTIVFLSIEFNKEGKQKLEEITKTYIETKNEEGETTTKKISINLDDDALLETYFSETITSGKLQLSIGSASTDAETIQSYIQQASQVASLITNNKMELKYELDSNTFLSSKISSEELKITLIVAVAIILVALIVLCVKYKANGVFASIAYIGFIALTLLILRYANVVIALEGIASGVVILIANYMFTLYILKSFKQDEDLDKDSIIKSAILHYIWVLLPLLIVSVVFTFIEWIPIASSGMIVFWSLIIMFIYNYIMSKALLEK